MPPMLFSAMLLLILLLELPTLPMSESAPTTLEHQSHVVARSVKLKLRLRPMLKLLSFMEDMDTHMVLDTTLDMPVLDIPVLVIPVLDMLVLDMLVLDMLV